MHHGHSCFVLELVAGSDNLSDASVGQPSNFQNKSFLTAANHCYALYIAQHALGQRPLPGWINVNLFLHPCGYRHLTKSLGACQWAQGTTQNYFEFECNSACKCRISRTLQNPYRMVHTVGFRKQNCFELLSTRGICYTLQTYEFQKTQHNRSTDQTFAYLKWTGFNCKPPTKRAVHLCAVLYSQNQGSAGSTWAAGSWLPPASSANHCRTPCRMPAGVLQRFCESSAGFCVISSSASSANDLHEIDRCPAEHSAILPAKFCTLVILPA